MRKVEAQIQKEVIKFCRSKKNLKLAFHVDNGAKDTVGEAMNAKRMGRLAGIPDICIPIMGGRTLWLELKTKDGKRSKVQIKRHEEMETLGHVVQTTYGLKEALEFLKYYV